MQALKIQRRRDGLTLVEMLVVVTILILLIAVALPMVQPAMEKTRMREGARLVNASFARARTRAIETGNPVGLLIEPTSGDPGACFTLRYAEIPPLFAGESTSSTVTIASDGTTTFSNASDIDAISLGDYIKLNYQGKKYRISDKAGNGEVWKYTDEGADATLAVTDAAFQVFKQPFRSTQTAPVQLPDGICIDVTASGIGDGTFASGQPIVILFNTSGMLEQVYTNAAVTPTSPVYLLVGEYGSLGTADLGELWVACGHQTGTIITADVAEATDAAVNDIVEARLYARSMQTKGGR